MSITIIISKSFIKIDIKSFSIYKDLKVLIINDIIN